MRAFSGTSLTFPYFALVVLAILLSELFIVDGFIRVPLTYHHDLLFA